MTPADLAAIAARVAIAPPERLAIDVTTLLAHIAALLAERVRQVVAALQVECSGKTVPLTVSAGVATLSAGEDAPRFLQRTDRALYHSKTGGRNRVTAAA